MIAYKVGPYSKNELTLSFDVSGALDFMQRMDALDNTGLEVMIECSHLDKEVRHPGVFVVKRSDLDWMKIQSHRLVMGLAGDSIEYLKFKLKNFINEGDFSPPEFISIERHGTKSDTQIYLEKIRD